MYRKASLSLVVLLSVATLFVAVSAQSTKCTGYPKMYNGKPCASTTRYFDGNMGACGCGTGNTNPFSWALSKPTAAASPPVFGASTWCGSGCGKCFKLTPTAVGQSPLGTGAKSMDSLVVKVTNLCPPEGNAEWCAYDVNSYGYDAHFDLMDKNMAGMITSMGWDNPEVVYEEVDCAANGYTDWNCQCASGGSTSGSGSSATTAPKATSAPTTAPKATSAPTTAPKATTAPVAKATTAPVAKATTAPVAQKATSAPVAKATTAPVAQATSAPTKTASLPTKAAVSVPTSGLGITIMGGSSQYWFGFQVDGLKTFTQVQVKDSSASAAWITMAYQGDSHWGMYYVSPATPFKLPLSLQFTTSAGTVKSDNVVASFDAVAVKTGLAL